MPVAVQRSSRFSSPVSIASSLFSACNWRRYFTHRLFGLVLLISMADWILSCRRAFTLLTGLASEVASISFKWQVYPSYRLDNGNPIEAPRFNFRGASKERAPAVAS
mmetsp:Transcript_34993/g.69540  ORF Transcript_34993/g.69540 Transcript_34993/m.69540 type:complete len:107 (+) Transcript_34993:105-425(+)